MISRLWSAVAERSGDTALDQRLGLFQFLAAEGFHPKRRRRCALPAHSKTPQ
jgi:hypothetical protein